MNTMELQTLERRVAQHQESVRQNEFAQAWASTYTQDVSALLAEVERLKNDLYRCLWGKP